MEFGIAGRRALVAGSSSGIGAAIAVALAAEGARVVIHGRHRDSAESVASTIRSASGEAAIIYGDLGITAEVEAVGHAALAAFGGIDILVNSAGASDHFHPWLDTSMSTWERQYQLSTLYAVRLIQMMVPAMRSNGWGRIINISSAVVYQPSAFAPDYTAAKAALHVASPGLAAALGAQGVTVNTVCAGTI